MLKNGGGALGPPGFIIGQIQYNFCTIKQLLRAARKHMEMWISRNIQKYEIWVWQPKFTFLLLKHGDTVDAA
jgi:hypothetical protein